MENMNENVGVMNNEVDAAAVDTESTKPRVGAALGTVVLGGCAIYGAVQLVKKGATWFKGMFGAKKAKKAKDDAVEIEVEDITDAE